MENIVKAPTLANSVPVIDMAAYLNNGETKGLIKEVRTACEEMAFFYVENHGISPSIISDAMDASRRFFEQPLDVRMRVEKDQFHRGYLPLGTTQFPGRGPDLKDSFDVGVELPLNDPDVVAELPLHGPNQWPELENFRKPIATYFSAVHEFGLRVLEILALSLRLDSSFFVRHYTKPTILMRLMHYPPQESALDRDSIGATPHTDFGVATVLYQDPSGGLELKISDGECVSAPFIPETFVVNLGQLMARWTNDVYRATPHRVVNRRSQDRYSIPFFFNPNHRARVECISTCQSSERPAKYPAVIAGEYIARLVQTNQDYQPSKS